MEFIGKVLGDLIYKQTDFESLFFSDLEREFVLEGFRFKFEFKSPRVFKRKENILENAVVSGEINANRFLTGGITQYQRVRGNYYTQSDYFNDSAPQFPLGTDVFTNLQLSRDSAYNVFTDPLGHNLSRPVEEYLNTLQYVMYSLIKRDHQVKSWIEYIVANREYQDDHGNNRLRVFFEAYIHSYKKKKSKSTAETSVAAQEVPVVVPPPPTNEASVQRPRLRLQNKSIAKQKRRTYSRRNRRKSRTRRKTIKRY